MTLFLINTGSLIANKEVSIHELFYRKEDRSTVHCRIPVILHSVSQIEPTVTL